MGSEPAAFNISEDLSAVLQTKKSRFKRRSYLYIPLIRLDNYGKNINCGADGIIFDLEDSVKPEAKSEARANIAKIADFDKPEGIEYSLRLNGYESTDFHNDLDAISRFPSFFDSITLPKTEGEEPIIEIRERFSDMSIAVLVETPLGVKNAWTIAEHLAPDKGDTFGFGAGDFSSSIGIDRIQIYDSPALTNGLLQLAEVSSTYGLPLLDTVSRLFGEPAALDLLRREAEFTKTHFNTCGKKAIHPSQIEAIHRVFTPGYKDIESLIQLLSKYEAISGLNAVRQTPSSYSGSPTLKTAIACLREWLQKGFIKLEAGSEY